ncbi:MAG: hypothetical protein AVDCRST_MAG78-1199, partial [uncultured Rubrobacteraceae bacterium]
GHHYRSCPPRRDRRLQGTPRRLPASGERGLAPQRADAPERAGGGAGRGQDAPLGAAGAWTNHPQVPLVAGRRRSLQPRLWEDV